MRLILSPQADRDLEAIADFIAQDTPRRALSFVKELRQQCQRICLNPQGYRLRPELGGGLRSCAYGNYVIFFDVQADAVLVQRILHGARDIDAIFGAGESANNA